VPTPFFRLNIVPVIGSVWPLNKLVLVSILPTPKQEQGGNERVNHENNPGARLHDY
jgi:hypothetical protein